MERTIAPASMAVTTVSEEFSLPAAMVSAGDQTYFIGTALGNPQQLTDRQRDLVWISGLVMLVVSAAKGWGMKQEHEAGFFLALWVISSIVMVLVNKIATMVFPLPLTLVLIQMIIADGLLLSFFGARQIVNEISSKASSSWRWSLLVMPFSGMLITSILALQSGRALTLLIVRNLLPLVSLFLERIFLPATSSQVTVEAALSLAMISGGTIFYAYKELNAGESSWLVLGYLMINMVSTIAHRLFERALLTDSTMTLSFTAASMVNNCVGMAPVTLALIARGEHHLWATQLHSMDWADPTALASIAVSGIAGLSLGYSSIAVQKQVTATTMLTLQTIMKMVLICLAVMILGESLSGSTSLGCSLSIAGGVWYGAVQKFGSLRATLEKFKGDK